MKFMQPVSFMTLHFSLSNGAAEIRRRLAAISTVGPGKNFHLNFSEQMPCYRTSNFFGSRAGIGHRKE
jgi:hypothetical protein